MRKSTLDILCCPVCKGDLELRAEKTMTREDGEEEIVEGVLWCAACGVEYPIQEGIPDLLPKTEESC